LGTFKKFENDDNYWNEAQKVLKGHNKGEKWELNLNQNHMQSVLLKSSKGCNLFVVEKIFNFLAMIMMSGC